MKRRLTLLAAGLLAGCLLACAAAVHAQASEQVSIGVGDTVAEIDGLTSPQAFVTVYDGTAVIGTTSSDTSGNFSVTARGMAAGIHNFAAYAVDGQGTAGSLSPLAVSLAEHLTTTAQIFLAPTVRQSAAVTPGQAVAFNGYTLPGSQLILQIDGGSAMIVTSADGSGYWSYTLPAATAPGNHSAVFQAISSNGNLGAPTEAQFFQVPAAARPATVLSLLSSRPGNMPLSPPAAPVITAPSDNSLISADSVRVKGTASAGSQIILLNGHQQIGSVLADSQGNWQLYLSLSQPVYSLTAKACQADRCSNESAPVSLRVVQIARPLVLKLRHYAFEVTTADPSVGLNLTVANGTEPIKVQVTWGDGAVTNLGRQGSSASLRHAYRSEPGRYQGAIAAVDAAGKAASLPFTVVVLAAPSRSPSITQLAVTGLGSSILLGAAVRRLLARTASRVK